MAKKIILFLLISLLSSHGKAQAVKLIFGGVGGRYNYLESQQANMAAKFNLGYDYSYDATSNTPDFSGSTDRYEVTKELHWNQTNTGLLLGFEVQVSEYISQGLYFEGKSNSASGKRTNTTQNYEETFSMKSKFGGIHYNFIAIASDRFSFFYDLGFTKYRLKFSADSPNSEVFKNQTMGYELHFLSSKYTPGSKSINIVNGLGADIALLKGQRMELSLRPEIGFAFNEMSEVALGVYYSAWIFNLNYVQCGLVIKTIISE